MNKTILNDALSGIDDDLLNNYFKIGAEYKTKRQKRLKWASAIAACLLVAVIVPCVVSITGVNKPHTDIENTGSDDIIDSQIADNMEMKPVNLFSDGQNLYFTNAFNEKQLIKYDGYDTILAQVEGRPADNRVFTDNMLFYTNSEGAFVKDLQSGKLTQLMSFGYEMPYQVTAINGYDPEQGAIPVDKSETKEECLSFTVIGKKVFFIHNARKSLGINYRFLGEEYWSTVYSFDMDSKEMTTVISIHSVDSLGYEYITEDPDCIDNLAGGMYIKSLCAYDEALFYFLSNSEINKYDPKTQADACIYSSTNSIYDVYWGDGKVYFSESTDQEGVVIHVILSLDATATVTKVETTQNYILGFLKYDAQKDLFYSLCDGAIISFPWSDAENYSVIHEISDNVKGVVNDVIFINDKLYFSYSTDGKLYYIVEVDDGEETIIIENGKPC